MHIKIYVSVFPNRRARLNLCPCGDFLVSLLPEGSWQLFSLPADVSDNRPMSSSISLLVSSLITVSPKQIRKWRLTVLSPTGCRTESAACDSLWHTACSVCFWGSIGISCSCSWLVFPLPLHPSQPPQHLHHRHHPALSDVRQSGMLDAEGERDGSRRQR